MDVLGFHAHIRGSEIVEVCDGALGVTLSVENDKSFAREFERERYYSGSIADES